MEFLTNGGTTIKIDHFEKALVKFAKSDYFKSFGVERRKRPVDYTNLVNSDSE